MDERQTVKSKKADRYTDRHGYTDRRKGNRRSDILVYDHIDKQMNEQIDRQTDTQTDKDKQTDERIADT